MVTFTNSTPGARGINLKSGAVKLVEAGQTVEVDDADVEAFHPDLATDDTPGQRTAPDPDLIRAAIEGLDHANDEHWTKGGQPSVDAVKAALGDDVTRAEIEAAVPDAHRIKPE